MPADQPKWFPCKAQLSSLIAALSLAPCAVTQAQGVPVASAPSQQSLTASDERKFEVVSIRPAPRDSSNFAMDWRLPDEYLAENFPLIATIELAYLPLRWSAGDWGKDRIVGAPAWVLKDRYSIRGKVSPDDLATWQHSGPKKEELLHEVLRAMLQDRCRIAVHRVVADAPVYALVVAKSTPRLRPAVPGEASPAGSLPLRTGGMIVPYVRGTAAPRITLSQISMAEFAALLSESSARLVIDKTGLAGLYDFSISKSEPPDSSPEEPSPPVIWDLAEVGLKLAATKAPLETVVVDHIERPSPN
jgi:uncharacterized protein (TIGR03435 family)